MHHPLLGRHEQLADLRVDFPTRDRDRLDKNVRPVPGPDRDLDLGTLPLHPHNPRPRVDTPLGPHEQQHGAATPVGVEHQRGDLARLVLTAIGNQFQVIETKVLAVELGTADQKHLGPFDPVLVVIFDLAGDPVLSRIGRQHLHQGAALLVGSGVPTADLLFFRVPLLVVGDPVQHEAGLSRNRASIERAGPRGCANRLPGAVEAPVNPGPHAKRLPSSHHRTRADNRPTRRIDDLGGDPVPVIGVGMEPPGNRRIDFQLHRPVLTNLHLVLHHEFRRLIRSAKPCRQRADAAPHPPARIPLVLRCKPPVAGSIQPVPATDREPVVLVRLALDSVLDRRLTDGSAEVVLGPDLRRDRLAQRHRSTGRFDRHLVLGLLVLLDPKRPATSSNPLVDPEGQFRLLGHNPDAVVAQVGIVGQGQLAIEASIRIGGELSLEQFLIPRIGDADRDLASGEYAAVLLVIAGLADPELELHRLAGPIDRPVSDHVDTGAVEDPGRAASGPGRAEPQVGSTATGPTSHHQPAESPLGICDLRHHLAIHVAELGELPDVDLVLLLGHPPLLVPEELDIRPGDR